MAKVRAASTLLALVLAGCASTSGVLPYGKGLFITSASDSTNLKTSAELKMHALGDANKYCSRQGKAMHAVDATERVGKEGASASVVFECE